MIDPILVVSAVRAAFRLYHAADSRIAQSFRDKAMQIPGARFKAGPSEPLSANELRDLVEVQNQGFKEWLETQDQGAATFAAMLGGSPEALREMRLFFAAFERADAAVRRQQTEDPEHESALLTMLIEVQEEEIANWLNDEEKPVVPWIGFAISLADIAAEFVAANPQVLIEGEDARALIGSFAGSISQLVPDDGNFGRQQAVGSRLMGIVLRAGLQTLATNRQILFDEDHVQALVDASLKPVIEQFPTTLAEQLVWEKVSDAVVGPALSAAFGAVAENPSTFFGERFGDATIVGAMTKDLLAYASENGIEGVLKREGLIGLYTTALGVVASRPELLLDGQGARTEFFKDLLVKVAETLKDHPLKLDKDVAALLAQATLESLGAHSGALLRFSDDEPWESVAVKALKQILDGLADGVADGDKLAQVFSRDQLIELARLVADQAGKTPEMIVGDSKELETVVAAIATAVAADEKLLLEGQDWLEIVAVALDEAGRNPGRLFGFKVDEPKNELGAMVISAVLAEAARTARLGRQGGAVLFGDTLIAAIITALRVASSNPIGVAEALKVSDQNGRSLISNLLEQVTEVVALKDEDGRFSMGSKEWLRLFRALLPEALAGGALVVLVRNGEITDEGLRKVEEILSGAAL